jgi:hypothetical protein
MKDINNPLIKAYYDAISPLYPTYEGEEPDNELAKIYVVISDVSSSDASVKKGIRHQAQIQVTINSWEVKYNNSKSMNTAAGAILQAVYPTPETGLTASGIEIITTELQNDNTTTYGKLAGRVYISRNLIFSHLISY